MSTDNEFTIRVKGAVPPPLPTKGRKKAAAPQKCTSQQQQQQQQRRYNMRLCPSTSINQLRKDVYALFNIPTDHIQSYQMSVLSGFPPKEMEQTGKATVHELGIRPNETITIRFTLADSSSNNATKHKEVLPRTNRPAMRASAKAASASFKNVLAAQDAIMKKEKKKVTKQKTTSTTGNVSGFVSVAASAASSKKSSKPKKVKMGGSGHRLSDGKLSVDDNEKQEAELLLSTHGEALGIGLDRAKQRTRALERVMGARSGNLLKFEEMKGGTNFNGGHVLGKKEDYGDDD